MQASRILVVVAAIVSAVTSGCASSDTVPQQSLSQIDVPTVTAPRTIVSGTLFVMDKNYYVGSSVDVVPPPYTAKPQRVRTGIQDPQAIGLDGNDDLFVNNENETLVEYAPPYGGIPRRTITTPLNNGGLDLGVAAAGELFLAPGWGPKLVAYKPPYTAAPIQNDLCPATSGCAGGTTLALSPTGTVFISGIVSAGDGILAYSSPYTTAPIAVNGTFGSIDAMATDSRGDLFVVDGTKNVVDEFAPPYAKATVVIRRSIETPFALAIDPHGNLYVANCKGCSSNWITRHAPPYTNRPTLVKGLHDVLSMAADATGRLFIGDLNGVEIYLGGHRQFVIKEKGLPEQLLLSR